jgi:hypothetical protein
MGDMLCMYYAGYLLDREVGVCVIRTWYLRDGMGEVMGMDMSMTAMG